MMDLRDTPISAKELAQLKKTPLPKIRYSPLTEEKKKELLDQAETRAKEILNAPSLSPESIRGNCFYVSSAGNDIADGRTPDTAWQTIARLHKAQEDGTIRDGDGVFFRRGDTFNSVFPTRWSGDFALRLRSHVTYSAYGVGKKPLFVNCIYASGSDSWQPTVYPHIWKCTHFLRGRYSDVGNILFDGGKAYGIKVTPADPNHPFAPGSRTVDSGMVSTGLAIYHSGGTDFTNPGCLAHNLEFFHNGASGELYLYWDGENPGEAFSEIVISRRGNILRGSEPSEDILIDNLAVKFTGSHGINFSEAKNVRIQNCEFGWIGGSLQEMDDGNTTRYGNAVENWGGCDGFSVRNCVVYQCYDAGLTSQSTRWDPENPCHMKNIDFSDNVLAYSNSPIELWNSNPPDKADPPYVNMAENVTVRRNHMLYSGYHFGHQRPYKNGSFGCLGGKAEGQIFLNSVMEDNRFLFSPSLMHYSRCIRFDDSETGIRLDHNLYVASDHTWYLKSCLEPVSGTGPSRLYSYNEETIAALAALGMESSGIFYGYEGNLFAGEEADVFLLT